MKVYDGIMQGLEEAIAYNERKFKAKTKTISISPVPDFEAIEIKNIRNELGMTQKSSDDCFGGLKKCVRTKA